jgi:hypothetical protein
MKNELKFLVAGMAYVPLAVIAAALLVASLMRLFGLNIPDFIALPLMVAVFSLTWVPSLSLVLLLLISSGLVPLWTDRNRTRNQTILTIAYTVTMALFVAYSLWALIARPTLDV